MANSKSLNQHLPEDFWNKSEYRTKYFRIKRHQIKVINSETKVIFLKRCLKFKVIPRTLQVSNKAPVEFFFPGQEQCWLEARSRGGIKLTKEALLLQTDLGVTLRGQLRRSVVELEDMVGSPEMWGMMENRLSGNYKSSIKHAQKRTRKRLRDLLHSSRLGVPVWL